MAIVIDGKEYDDSNLVLILNPFVIGSEMYLYEISIELLFGSSILIGILWSKA